MNDPNLTPSGSGTAATRAKETNDDLHLAELVRSLRMLAAESPERLAHIERIARAYALGTYRVDVEATAARIIDDALTGR